MKLSCAAAFLRASPRRKHDASRRSSYRWFGRNYDEECWDSSRQEMAEKIERGGEVGSALCCSSKCCGRVGLLHRLLLPFLRNRRRQVGETAQLRRVDRSFLAGRTGQTTINQSPVQTSICAPRPAFNSTTPRRRWGHHSMGSSIIRWNVVAWAGRQSRQAKQEKTVSRSPFLLGSLFYFLLPPLSRRLICGQIKRDEWITLLPLGFKPTSKPVVFSPDAVPVHTTQGDGRTSEKCA